MTDENPHRFTGDASERPATTDDETSASTLAELRSKAFMRSVFAAIALLHGVSFATWLSLTILAANAIDFSTTAPLATSALGSMANACTWPSLIGLLLFGVSFIPQASPRFGLAKSLGLLVPGINPCVAYLLLRDASRNLVRHGVRLGWLRCDFSRAKRYAPVPQSAFER